MKFKIFITARIHAIHEKFFFSSIFRVGFELYLPLFFASVYNLKNMKWDSGIDTYSNTVAFVWIILLIVMPLSVIFVCHYFPNKYSEDTVENSKFMVLLQDFKDNKKHLMFEHFIFMLRRIGLTLIVVFRWKHGLQQTIMFLVL